MSIFKPPQRLLLGPGPSPVPDNILAALAEPTVGHLDPVFINLMNEVRALLQYALQTQNRLTLPISAPASAAMECGLVNLIEPGDKVLVCINGVFGGRMADIARRCGAQVIEVNATWGKPIDPDAVEQALKQNSNISLVACVHAETSTGVESDVASIARLAQNYGALSFVDAVTSVGGIPFYMDAWGIDVAYTGSQKCLSCVPGVAPISFSEKAIVKIKLRQNPIQSWFLDMKLLMGYWLESEEGTPRAYHHTAPVNSFYALYEALKNLKQEGLEHAWLRHKVAHDALKKGLDKQGLSLLIEPHIALPQINLVNIPQLVDDLNVRQYLLNKHDIEIGGGLGAFSGKVWRVGLMGAGAKVENVDLLLASLSEYFA